jgi:hypothetical protein
MQVSIMYSLFCANDWIVVGPKCKQHKKDVIALVHRAIETSSHIERRKRVDSCFEGKALESLDLYKIQQIY